MGTDEQVAGALRRIETASQVLNEAADALRTIARHLEGGAEPRWPDFSGLEGGGATGTAGERLGALAKQHDVVARELGEVLIELDHAGEREEVASEFAADAMRALGAAEARGDAEGPGLDAARAARVRAHEQALEARQTLAEHQEHSARLAARAASLRRDLELVTARVDELRRQTRELSAARTTDVPVRELALGALDEIGVPAPSNLLSRYIAARFGREIKSSRWGPLRADERQAFQREDEAGQVMRLWLQPALGDDGREEPRLWVRSDWAEERRTVRDLSDAGLLNARACYLAELAVDPPEGTADVHGLRLIAADEAERARMYPSHGQSDLGFLEDPAQAADYTQWPPPKLPDVPF